nr:3'(2'),5'-bisphosphate nucleotidase CysQ [Motiliproteus sp. SC1-56]
MLPQIMKIAREAGDLILTYYHDRPRLDIAHKADESPVTSADLAAHELITASLVRLTPDIPVLSEESPAKTMGERHHWPRYWLVDPLDGTKEFIHGNGEFTVNIALVEAHRAVLGAVHIPVSHTTYGGSLRTGAVKLNQQGRQVNIRSRPLTPYRPASVLVSRSHQNDRTQQLMAQLDRQHPLSITPVGSSLKLCLIAEGMADLHLRTGRTSEWDTAAAQAVLEAAGGVVTDLQGSPLRYNTGASLYNPEFIAQADPTVDWLGLLGEA